MAADSTAPVLNSLTIPKTVNLAGGNAPFTIAASATDSGSGVKDLIVWLDAPLTYSFSTSYDNAGTFSLLPNYGSYDDPWNDGQSAKTYGILATNSNQTYHVASVDITDNQGNKANYTASQLQALGVNTAFTLTGSTNSATQVQFSQKIQATDGEVTLSLSGENLPSQFNIALSLNYTSSLLAFDNISFSGISGTSVRATSAGNLGTLTVSGSVTASPEANFATIHFKGTGTGTFNADITQLTINGNKVGYTDPAPVNFSLSAPTIPQSISLNEDTTSAFAVNPFNDVFPASSLKTVPSHGTLTKSTDTFSTGKWIYTPNKNYFGNDSFVVSATSGAAQKDLVYDMRNLHLVDHPNASHLTRQSPPT